MYTIAISINRGGVGKTTLTKSLAVAASLAGFNVFVLDLDSQQNAADWGNRRKQHAKPLPVVKFIVERDLLDEKARADAAGCDFLFLDTPPGKSTEAMAAIEEADIVLIPFSNEFDAYTGLLRTAKLARRLEKPAYGVLNFATPHSKSHEDEARETLSDEKVSLPMAPVVLHRYDVHRKANIEGLTAQEFDPNCPSAAEIVALWDWLSALVQSSTSATVHKGVAA